MGCERTRWTFRRPDGIGQGNFSTKDEALHAWDDQDFREMCGPGCALEPITVSVHYVIGEIPEHFNVTTNCVIRGRSHLRRLQKERGWQDYEPDSGARAAKRPKELTREQKRVVEEAVRLGDERARTVHHDTNEPIEVEVL